MCARACGFVLCVRAWVCVRARMCVCVGERARWRVCGCTRACVCVCGHVCGCVCVCKARIATNNRSYSQAVTAVAARTASRSSGHSLQITATWGCSIYSSVRSCRTDNLHHKTHTHPSNKLQVAGLAHRIESMLRYQIVVPTSFTRIRRLDRDTSAILSLQGTTEERGHVVVSWQHSDPCGSRAGAYLVLKFVR